MQGIDLQTQMGIERLRRVHFSWIPASGPPDLRGNDVWGGTVIRCPLCLSEETRVASTRRPVRHHKCLKCGHCLKSVEGNDVNPGEWHKKR